MRPAIECKAQNEILKVGIKLSGRNVRAAVKGPLRSLPLFCLVFPVNHFCKPIKIGLLSFY